MITANAKHFWAMGDGLANDRSALLRCSAARLNGLEQQPAILAEAIKPKTEHGE